MSSLSDIQRKSLFSGVIIIVLAIFLDRINTTNDQGWKILLWSITSIIFALVISYSFVFYPSHTKQGFLRLNQFSRRNDGFKPRIIPPSIIKKKTQFKGNCDYCSESASLGFTCSYCNGFYCSNHRIPEKHHCLGISPR